MVCSFGQEASSFRSSRTGTQVIAIHKSPLQHNLIEGGVRLSGQQPWVDALTLGLLVLNVLVLLVANVNILMAPSAWPHPEKFAIILKGFCACYKSISWFI